MITASPVVPARFVDRPNRFVAVAELEDGRRVDAHLPNTGRLEHLLIPGRPLVLRHEGNPRRVTAYTATRVWDGCWVGLEARIAPRLLEAWVRAGHRFSGFGRVLDVRREVTLGEHRFDLVFDTVHGEVWVEVKSGGRADGGSALLSKTPSTRGVAHLAALGRLAAHGAAAAAFVAQRSDVRRLRIGGDADPDWIEAVRRARRAGVVVVAFGCDVTETDVRIARTLPVRWEV